jgi:lincosamide nucleotidyltransferase
VEAALKRGVEWLHVDYEPHLADFYRACGFRPTKAGLIHLGLDGDTVSLSPSDRVKTSASRSTTLSEVPIFSGDAAKHLAPTLQLDMIERLRTACRDDLRVIAATLYGSFVTGEADAYSDIEAALYFVPEALATLDRQAWVAQIAPVELFFADDFGHYTAIFANLVRGEFHFHAADRIPEVAGWRGSAWFPSVEAAVLVDRTGDCRQIDGLENAPPDRDPPEMAARLAANFANGVLFGSQVLARGEAARSLEVLVFTLRYLEWLARLVEGNVAHWPTPSRRWERDLSAEAQARFIDCTARSSR